MTRFLAFLHGVGTHLNVEVINPSSRCALSAVGQIQVERRQVFHDLVQGSLSVFSSGPHSQVVLGTKLSKSLALGDVVFLSSIQLRQGVITNSLHLSRTKDWVRSEGPKV